MSAAAEALFAVKYCSLLEVAVGLDFSILPKLGKMIPCSSPEMFNSRVTSKKINTISKQDGGRLPTVLLQSAGRINVTI